MKPRAPIARYTPLRRVSTRRARELRLYSKKRREFLARFKWCQMCDDVPPSDVHHRCGRVGAKLNDESQWFALCRRCHDLIHSRPSEARAKGWLL